MVRGISKQVIVVEGNNRDFFENAIFILKEDSLKEGIGEKDLLRQAKTALTDINCTGKRRQRWNSALWAIGGFFLSCGLWLLTILL